MDEYLTFAQDLARQAGKLIKDNFESNLTVELKADHSPVTQVDKAINDLVSNTIKQAYPDHGLLGEELSHGTGQEPLQWLCDPLDGTKAFIVGAPLSTFILGLTQEGGILLSVVYDPYSERLYHAVKGQGAFCNDQLLHVNDTSLADGGYVLVQEASFQFAPDLQAAGAQTEPMPGAGYRAMILANARCSGIIQAGADFHDVGPSSLIVEEAGGKVTDFSGAPIHFDHSITNGIILSNGTAHDELLDVVNRRR